MFGIHLLLEPFVRAAREAVRSRPRPTRISTRYMRMGRSWFCHCVLLVRVDLVSECLSVGTVDVRSAHGIYHRMDFPWPNQLHLRCISLRRCICTRRQYGLAVVFWSRISIIRHSDVQQTRTALGIDRGIAIMPSRLLDRTRPGTLDRAGAASLTRSFLRRRRREKPTTEAGR